MGLALGVLPGLAVFVFLKSNAGEPWRISNFISGWLLVGIATIMVGIITDWGPIFDVLRAQGKISPDDHEKIKSSSAVWLAVFPATFGGIGVNVIVAWLLSKRPS